jgi:hypothetical protein
MTRKKSVRLIDWIDTGMFQPKVMLTVGYSVDDVKAYLKKQKAHGWINAVSYHEEKIKASPGSWWALKTEVENRRTKQRIIYFFILIPEFQYSDECYLKLAHECLHICQFFLPDILDRDREFECEAYLHTHLMRQCLAKIKG